MNMQDVSKFDGFLKLYGIVVNVVEGASDPYVMPEWAVSGNKRDYAVTVRRGDMVFETEYYAGSWDVDTEQPTVFDVVSCLVNDYRTLGSGYWQFEEWAEDVGFDTDSRKAYAVWEKIVDNSRQLAKLVGGYPRLEELASIIDEIEEW